jgi:hypothetical protein
LIRFALGKTIGASLLIAWVVLIAVVLIFEVAGAIYIRLRFSERRARIAQLKCRLCSGAKSVSVASVVGKRVQIGSEGRWLQISIAGMS